MIDIQYNRPVPEDCESIVLAEETILPLASPDFIARYRLARVEDVSAVPLIHSVRGVVQWEPVDRALCAARDAAAPRADLRPRLPRPDGGA